MIDCLPENAISIGNDPAPLYLVPDTSQTRTWVASRANPSDAGSDPPISPDEEDSTHQYDRSLGGFTYTKEGTDSRSRRKTDHSISYSASRPERRKYPDSKQRPISKLEIQKYQIQGLGMDHSGGDKVLAPFITYGRDPNTVERQQSSFDYQTSSQSFTIGHDASARPVTNKLVVLTPIAR